MKLGALFPVTGSISTLDITGVTADSRQVRPGMVFFAMPGSRTDGTQFAAAAVQAGAIAVIGEPLSAPAGVSPEIYGHMADIRLALAEAAARFYLSQPAKILAVTGTSGKTSVVDFTRQILIHCGQNAASVGTIGVISGAGAHYGSLTTPDPVSLHETLDHLARDGVTHLAMEASSHGLDQRRLDGVRLAAAAFTNLGHDHLDYHGTRDAYLAAKMRLFDTLLPIDGVAVVNSDDSVAETVRAIATKRGIRVFSTGWKGDDLRITALRRDGFDQHLELSTKDGAVHSIKVPLLGDFQISNALVAAGLAIVAGVPVAQVLAAISTLKGVPGRLERAGYFRDGLIIIDYAHKPEALEHALRALRSSATGRLICVFGCGGDRDRAKRPLMGAIAANNADLVIVTDDNPRSENPATIRAAILEACPGAGEIADRFEAIRTAINLMQSGDVLLIAGKGHETGQIIGDRTIPFSDHEAVDTILKGMMP